MTESQRNAGEPYPLPSHAANIWLVGDQLMLGLPGTNGARPHTVPLSCDANGMLVLKHILHARAQDALASQPSTIGKRSAPTQLQAEEWLKAMRQAQREGKVTQVPPKVQRSAKEVLSIEDLDL